MSVTLSPADHSPDHDTPPTVHRFGRSCISILARSATTARNVAGYGIQGFFLAQV